VFQRITENALTECPECHGLIQRVLFPAGVVFKGSGWYVTDYRNGSEKAKYEAETKGESAPSANASEKKSDAKPSVAPSESKADSKTETKTETKADTKTTATQAA
jgi:predicted nucleic acid-binding Zn ribbon protein